jgi:hypothetical protein
MWKAFDQPNPGTFKPNASQTLPNQNPIMKKVARPGPMVKPLVKGMGRIPSISKPVAKLAKSVKVPKPKKGPMAPAPKPLPKPKPQQLTPTQATKQQTLQHQQLAQHLHKELMKPDPQQRIYPQLPTPSQKLAIPTVPITNGYDERDKDELVFHSRIQHPFKTISQTKSGLSGQKRGF